MRTVELRLSKCDFLFPLIVDFHTAIVFFLLLITLLQFKRQRQRHAVCNLPRQRMTPFDLWGLNWAIGVDKQSYTRLQSIGCCIVPITNNGR